MIDLLKGWLGKAVLVLLDGAIADVQIELKNALIFFDGCGIFG
jgi:hypothetical protein